MCIRAELWCRTFPAEKPGTEAHGKTDLAAAATSKDLEHGATLAAGSHLRKLAGTAEVKINSSHHQSIDRPGEKLQVTARGTDGIIEGVEMESPRDWVVGVQWHPERMPDDALAQELFADFVGAARKARLETAEASLNKNLRGASVTAAKRFFLN